MENKYNMDNQKVLQKIREIVVGYNNNNCERKITEDDVYIVWFCKALQNWKALASSNIRDGLYYELTFDGDKNRIYVDIYQSKATLRVHYK